MSAVFFFTNILVQLEKPSHVCVHKIMLLNNA